MKHKTSELTGALLDAAVAKACGMKYEIQPERIWGGNGITIVHPKPACLAGVGYFEPSTNPATAWPIIERERIKLDPVDAGGMFIGVRQDRDGWLARCPEAFTMERGDTALIAACRAFVAHKMGEEVEL